jgi:acyl-CoA hydrolase/GNAT superfamily N-acetyltransferase
MSDRWKTTYEERRTVAARAVLGINPGDRVFLGTAAGEPAHLVSALADHAPQLADVELIQFHTLGEAPYLGPAFTDRIRANSLFVGESIREAVTAGLVDYTPLFLSQIPGAFRSRIIPIDVALIMVGTPDEHGYFSLGPSVDITHAAAGAARVVIAQVNPRMPRTFGSGLLHVSEIDSFVEYEEELLTNEPVPPDRVHEEIALHVGRLVPDGATVQVGAGRIPNAVMPYLADKRDLGVHTELFSDGLMELVKSGAVTGRRKTFHPGRIVTSMAFGKAELYRYLDRNPAIEFHGSDYVNSPVHIAANDRMVAINSGLQVDLTGQVCADSLGYRSFSGMGGHADFTRGAALSKGGKPIIALPSTADTPEGTVSRIVLALTEGAGVVTTRGDVHYVVTEHGIAYLHGKSMRERAMALISVAHPDFREELLGAAKGRHLVFADQILPPPGTVYPAELEKRVEIKDGQQVLIRPIKGTDDDEMKDLFYSFSEQTRYLRFHSVTKEMPHSRRQVFCSVDYHHEMAIVAEIGSDGQEDLVGVARYMMDEGDRSAEVAFVVRDDWQGKGLGGLLFAELADIAKSRSIDRLTAEVLLENRAMIRVFRNSGYPMKTSRESGVISVELALPQG